jgi:diguanylate cyclase (GGDEF)-like protein/PAS domain S-box-containing protein
LSHAAEFEAKRSQVALLARFEAMYRGAVFAIALVDARGRIVDCNPAMSEILGYEQAEFVGSSLNDYAHPGDVTADACLFDQLMHGERDAFRVEKRYIAKTGEVVWGHVAASLVHDARDESRYAIVMIGNISDLKAAEEELRRHADASQYLALHDALTGLPNRRLFDDRIDQAVRTAERDGDRLAVMIMDLDRFKEVNDTRGHDSGDEVLRKVGSRMDDCLRASDTIARLGGDEFGFLLVTQTARRELTPLLEKLTAAVELPIELDGSPVVVHASIGVAFYPDDGTQREQLVKRADAAMYRAKHSGLRYAFFEHADVGAARSG